MIWFTSDTHFGHVNIIPYCNRPFANVEEMDKTMVERWNARVQPGDTVYHLGDFAFGPVENIPRMLAQLNGRITLVLGNHDRRLAKMSSFGFEAVGHELFIEAGGWRLLLIHKPIVRAEQRAEHEGLADFVLHGHVHEKWARRGNLINVGVDVRGFAPAT